MMGSSATTRKGVCTRGPALRSASSAIMVPMITVPVAVSSAKNKVFQATPQRTPPLRQLRPQMRSWPMRSKIAENAHCPSSFKKAPYKALVTGKAINNNNNTEQLTTAEAMNKSPLKNPRRATPNAVIITSASKATKAPMPIPNWLTPSSPNWVFNTAKDQPLAPIMKPLSSSPRNPTHPPARSQELCGLPGGTSSPIPAKPKPNSPSANQTRP